MASDGHGSGREATQPPTDTPLYESLRRRVEAAHPGAEAAPWMNVGATDAAFFRRRGAVAYGAGSSSRRRRCKSSPRGSTATTNA